MDEHADATTPTALEAIGRDGLLVGLAWLARDGTWHAEAGTNRWECRDREEAENWLLAHGAVLVREEAKR